MHSGLKHGGLGASFLQETRSRPSAENSQQTLLPVTDDLLSETRLRAQKHVLTGSQGLALLWLEGFERLVSLQQTHASQAASRSLCLRVLQAEAK